MRPINNVEELKRVQMDIMTFVDKFCREHNICYSISGGTLIGAIRHGGYIPWDDDIDILLRREDYDRLVNAFLEKDTGKYVIYQYGVTKGYNLPYVKIADSSTVLNEPGVRGDFGINIDVFPFDHIAVDKQKITSIYCKAKNLINKHGIKLMEWRKGRSFHKNLILMLGKIVLFPISILTYVEKIDKLARNAGPKDSPLRACIVWGYGEKEVMDASIFDEYYDIKFEDRTFMAIKKYDEYLTHLYGDYMKLPPLEKQVSHHDFTAWWKD